METKQISSPYLFYSDTDFPSDKIVSFIDILGFRNLVSEMATEPKIYKRIRGLLEEIERRVSQSRGIFTTDLSSIQFSDSIVHSISFNEDNFQDKLNILLQVVSRMAGILLEYGVFTRGGISIGWIHHEGSVVVGQGLIEAYDLESKIAKYPRIILDKKLDKYLNLYKEDNIIDKDNDDYYYLNLFNEQRPYYDRKVEQSEIIHFQQVKIHIQNSLENSKMDQRVFEKYKWIAAKFNLELQKEYLEIVGKQIGLIKI